MANKGINFSDIKVIDDGINLIFKAGSIELFNINKTSKLFTTLGQLNVKPTVGVTEDFYVEGTVRIDDITIEDDGTELLIKSGVNNLLKFNKSTQKITNTAIEFTGTVTTGVLKPNEIQVATGGSKAIAGEVTLSSPGGYAIATVNTSAVQTDSIIICTAKEQLLAAHLWADNISAGTSFQINADDSGDDGKKVAWLLINPI